MAMKRSGLTSAPQPGARRLPQDDAAQAYEQLSPSAPQAFARAAGRPLSTSDIARLQRVVGNQAVSRLVAPGRQRQPTAGQAASAAPLQRVLEIKKGKDSGTYYTGGDLPKNLAIPIYPILGVPSQYV